MKRPWNIVNMPVYSLATYGEEGVNMNICTYVTAVSRKPKLYAIALEEGSASHENMQKCDEAVLQVFTSSQQDLVRVLGKRTGHSFDKEEYLSRHGLLTRWHGKKVLGACAAYTLLLKQSVQPAGDHHLYVLRATRFSTISENNILMFQDLVKNKLIL
jgi:flavin reductase (DIM6/NTAB) family NADH-FMN oxidoreductase RutF